MFVENSCAHGAIMTDGVLDSTTNKPGQREVLALTAFHSARVQQPGTAAGSGEQTPLGGFVPKLNRWRSHEREIVCFRSILDPGADQGESMAEKNSCAIVERVPKNFRRPPRKLGGNNPVRDRCAGADFPNQSGFHAKRAAFPRKLRRLVRG